MTPESTLTKKTSFFCSTISIVLKISVFLSAASMLGFQTTSFVALFTAA